MYFNNSVGTFSGKGRPKWSNFLRFIHVLAANCKLLKTLWAKIRIKILLELSLFVKTHCLSFENRKWFRCLFLVNREENSTFIEQYIYPRPGTELGNFRSSVLRSLNWAITAWDNFNQFVMCFPTANVLDIKIKFSANRDRTRDLPIFTLTLSQLNYHCWRYLQPTFDGFSNFCRNFFTST